MVEWLVGSGMILGVALIIVGCPYAAGWVMDKMARERNSGTDRWLTGAFVVVTLVLFLITPWVIGRIVLEAINGG